MFVVLILVAGAQLAGLADAWRCGAILDLGGAGALYDLASSVFGLDVIVAPRGATPSYRRSKWSGL